MVEVEEYGVDRLLGELADELKARRYRPLAARRVMIPNPGGGTEQRPLSIPMHEYRNVTRLVTFIRAQAFSAGEMVAPLGRVGR
ncbi:hypothetical protein AB0J63_01485 [Streptosporangium canum]|uniref:hypothetical protein n=1 Tax=Streptosporangium canum TaxID=324952 RepID=UPI003432BC18